MSEFFSQGDSLNFNRQVLQSDLPVLVDCWAEWCAPCKAIAPVLDGMAKEYHDRLRVMKMGIKVQSAFN